MIKAVIFDMNGIIIDDEHIHELAFKETLKPFEINFTHDDYLECCAGKTDENGYEYIAYKFSIKLPTIELLQKKAEWYLKFFPENKKTYPGVLELIQKLSKKYVLALTSSSSRAEVDLITKEFDLKKYFQVTISADEITKGKPDPEPYLKTILLLKIKPKECLVIEDSKSGVLSAKAAGCYCIGVTTTHDKDSLLECDLITDSFKKINLDLVQSLGR